MVSTTAAVVVGDGIVKISGTGAVVVVVVVVAAGTNVATAGMTAGWNWVAYGGDNDDGDVPRGLGQ